MARSLTVTQEEAPRANWLLIGFVVLAAGFMALGYIASSAMDGGADVLEATE